MQEQIGNVAGNVWNVLGQKERMALGNLPKYVDGNKEVAFLALGWLAREGKVKFEKEGDAQIISLSEPEKETYKRSNNKH